MSTSIFYRQLKYLWEIREIRIALSDTPLSAYPSRCRTRPSSLLVELLKRRDAVAQAANFAREFHQDHYLNSRPRQTVILVLPLLRLHLNELRSNDPAQNK